MLLVFAVGPAAADPPLRFGFLPYLSSAELIRRYGPLTRHLSAAIGRDMYIHVAADYGSHMKAVIDDELDIAFLGALPYVRLVEAVGPRPLLARFAFNGEPSFRGVIFTAEAAPYRALADLEGRRIGVGDPRSTLSSIMPRHALGVAGVTVRPVPMTTHDNIILGVLLGELDAGAVAEEVFDENRHRGLRPIAYTERISTHVFVASPRLDASTIERLRGALLSLDRNHPDGATVLNAAGSAVSGFVAVADSDYDSLRAVVASFSEPPDGAPQ